MVRSFALTRLAAGLALVPFAVFLAAGCGGSDYVDTAAEPDAGLRDVSEDPRPAAETGPDSNRPDTGPDAEAGVVDAGLRDADASLGEAEAGLRDADASLPEAEASLRDADAALPEAEASLRDADAGRPEAEASLPEAEASLPEAEASLPEAEASLPEAEASLPEAEASLPEAEASLPEAEASVDAEAGIDADADGGPGLLGSASRYGVLGGSTVTITPAPPNAPTTIVGDVGVSPGTAIATLSPGQPIGNIHAGDPVALQAQADLTIAYNTLAGMACLPANNRSGVDLGGLTLPPGVYCFNTSAGITGDLVLDAQLDPNAMWVFQVGSTLTTATISSVTVINGGSACNVYWKIGSSATLGTGTRMVGSIVALASITLVTGSTVLPGRTLAINGAVALDQNAISVAPCQ